MDKITILKSPECASLFLNLKKGLGIDYYNKNICKTINIADTPYRYLRAPDWNKPPMGIRLFKTNGLNCPIILSVGLFCFTDVGPKLIASYRFSETSFDEAYRFGNLIAQYC